MIIDLYKTNLDPDGIRVTANIEIYLSHFEATRLEKEVPQFIPQTEPFTLTIKGGNQLVNYNYMRTFYLGEYYYYFLSAMNTTPECCTFTCLPDWWSMGQVRRTPTTVSGILTQSNELLNLPDQYYTPLVPPLMGVEWVRDVGTLRNIFKNVRFVIGLTYHVVGNATEYHFIGMSTAVYDITSSSFMQWYEETVNAVTGSTKFKEPYNRVTEYVISSIDLLYLIPDALVEEYIPLGETDKSAIISGTGTVSTSWDQFKSMTKIARSTFRVNSNEQAYVGNALVNIPISFTGTRDQTVVIRCSVDRLGKSIAVTVNYDGTEVDITQSLCASYRSYERSAALDVARAKETINGLKNTVSNAVTGAKAGGVYGAAIGAVAGAADMAINASMMPKYSAVDPNTGAVLSSINVPSFHDNTIHVIGLCGIYTINRRNASDVDNFNVNYGFGCAIPIYQASIYSPSVITKGNWYFRMSEPLINADLPTVGREAIKAQLIRGVMVSQDTPDVLAYGVPNSVVPVTTDLTEYGWTEVYRCPDVSHG